MVKYCVYILKSEKDDGLYIGQCKNLERRLREHKVGQVQSTKGRLPLVLKMIFPCRDRDEAIILERTLKQGYKREQIKKLLN